MSFFFVHTAHKSESENVRVIMLFEQIAILRANNKSV
jgi:hypothetical protein